MKVARHAIVRGMLIAACVRAAPSSRPAGTRPASSTRRTVSKSAATAVRAAIAQEDQQKMMRLTQGRKESDISDITAYVGKSVSQVRQDNTPIIAYRDELYNRLPKTPETFAIAFEDAFQRLNAAAEAKDLVK